MIWVGTSGWVYGAWRGRLYPEEAPQRTWLRLFAESFSTVEINNSFYRLPSLEAFRAWHETVPAGFLFAVKASRFITHLKRLREGAEPNELFWSRARALGDRMGPVLYQLPPRFPADPPRLDAFLRTVPPAVRAAFEFRDRSWLRDDVFALLDGAGAALVLADTPGARVAPVVTGGWSYVRFHRGSLAGPRYPRAKLVRWAERIAGLPASDVYVYFNNDQEGAAVVDALAMRSMLRDRGCEVR